MSDDGGDESGDSSGRSESWEALPDSVKKENASIAANRDASLDSSEGEVDTLSSDGDDE